MRCPDCGAALSEVRVDGTHFVHMCNRCGGALSDSETVNNITANHMAKWRRIGVDPRWLVGGDDKCPVCGTRIQRYRSEEVPAELLAKRCSRCGKWWFPGDSLFRLKEAQEVKINYFRIWFGSPNVPKLLLPLAVTAMVIVTLGVGVGMVQVRQRAQVSAGVGVEAFVATYLGGGEVALTFASIGDIEYVEYKMTGEIGWVKLPVEKRGGVYLVTLSGLLEGEWYQVRIAGKEYEFETRN